MPLFEANNRKGVHMSENKTYEAPALRELGSVEELTQGSILTGNPDGGLFITVSV
ncbi:MAG: lasso RiPP family leader peptide-containing protein [Acidimicrobiales bacterium]